MHMKQLTCLVIFFILATPRFSTTSVNETTRMSMVQNLLEHGVAWTEGSYYFNFVDMAYDNGHYYSSQLPLLPAYSALVSKPVHALVRFNTPEGRMTLFYWIVLTSSGLGLWLIYGLVRRLCREFPLFTGQETRTTMGIFLGSAILAVSSAYTSHVLEGMLELAGFYGMLRHRQNPRWPWAAAAGAALALSPQIHPLAGGVFSSRADCTS